MHRIKNRRCNVEKCVVDFIGDGMGEHCFTIARWTK